MKYGGLPYITNLPLNDDVVYGRRRVGKTFLIRNAFNHQFSFQVTALGNATLTDQLANFRMALQNCFGLSTAESTGNWLLVFQRLAEQLELSGDKKKIVFIDELPWFDTRGSGFIQALEHFWNSWASARDDIILVVCGSAASWMINKLINNRGGLHNRVTRRIKLLPFNLQECELFLQSRNSVLDRYQIVQLYMDLGGIPFYWEEVRAGKSAAQNIGEICFSETGLLRNEYSNLYKSLFSKSKNHEAIIEALAAKTKGLTREEIINSSGLPNAGSTTRILNELEESGSIRKYTPFGKLKRNRVGTFIQDTGTRKSIFLTLLTTFGIKTNKHSSGLVQNDLSLEDLFI